ncbi:MAG: hypothetical protein QOE61_1761 [Micromonosporaceae bacterium]|jgi:hypothetical protein|nr:hypothetical protein [Micromonosporaceae bacterium]
MHQAQQPAGGAVAGAKHKRERPDHEVRHDLRSAAGRLSQVARPRSDHGCGDHGEAPHDHQDPAEPS